MAQISLRLDDDLLDNLEDEADERDLSRSEYIRGLLEERPAAGHVDVDDYQALARALRETEQKLSDAEARRDDLRRQLAASNSRQDDVGEVVEYVEQEKALQERREEREAAPVWRRFKWWVFGAPTSPDAEEQRASAVDGGGDEE